MTDQTPEARFAAALGTVLDYPILSGGTPSWNEMAAAILAADPTLAADLVLAEKARYLLNGAHDQLRLLRSVVLCGEQLAANESETLSGLLAAIEEALRDE